MRTDFWNPNSMPIKEFRDFCRQMARSARKEEKRLKDIEANCVRIRREEIRLVRNNVKSAINWSDYV